MAFNNVGSLTVSLLGNTASATTGLDKMSTKVAAFGAKVTAVGVKVGAAGKAMTLAITAPLVAIGTLSVVAFDKQAKALAQVEAGIKSTGAAAGFTVDELADMASGLQRISTYGDEDILRSVTAQLLTFTNIANEQFADTQEAVLDLAARMGTDLKSAALQLGKALNDPIANLSALSRSGIQFSDSQKDVIKSLWETGQQAEAQTVILEELEKQFGGSTEAMVVGAGKITQLKNTIGDLMEGFGEVIMLGLDPLIERFQDWLAAWKDMSIEERSRIIRVALVVGALGPLLVVLGKILVIIPKIGAAWTTLSALVSSHPIVAAVLALGAAFVYLYAKVDEFRYFMQDVFVGILNIGKTALNGVTLAINGVIEGINLLIKGINLIPGINIPEIGKLEYLDLTNAVTQFDEVRAALDRVNEAVGDIPTDAAIAEWKRLTDAIVEKYSDVYPEIGAIQKKGLEELESGVATSIEQVTTDMRRAVEDASKATVAITAATTESVGGMFETQSIELHFLTLKLEEKLLEAGVNIKMMMENITPALQALIDEFGALSDELDTFAKGTVEHSAAIEKLEALYKKVSEAVAEAGENVSTEMLNLKNNIEDELGKTETSLRENVMAWASAGGAIKNTAEGIGQFLDSVVSGVANTFSTFFNALSAMKETNEKALEDYKTALQGFADAEGEADKSAAEARRIALRDLSDDLEDDKITREYYAREKAQIESDYSKAVEDAGIARKKAGDAELIAYHEQQVGIEDILGDMLHALLTAIREQLQLEAAKEAVIAAAMLFALNIPGSIAHGLAAAAYLTGATGLAIAGYEQGGVIPGPSGQPVIIQAHGKERVLTEEQQLIDYGMIGKAVAAGTYDAMKEVIGQDAGRPIIVQVGEAQLARVMYPALAREGQRLGVTG